MLSSTHVFVILACLLCAENVSSKGATDHILLQGKLVHGRAMKRESSEINKTYDTGADDDLEKGATSVLESEYTGADDDNQENDQDDPSLTETDPSLIESPKIDVVTSSEFPNGETSNLDVPCETKEDCVHDCMVQFGHNADICVREKQHVECTKNKTCYIHGFMVNNSHAAMEISEENASLIEEINQNLKETDPSLTETDPSLLESFWASVLRRRRRDRRRRKAHRRRVPVKAWISKKCTTYPDFCPDVKAKCLLLAATAPVRLCKYHGRRRLWGRISCSWKRVKQCHKSLMKCKRKKCTKGHWE